MAGTLEDTIPQVLVTGASGFTASHIIQQLLTSGQVKVRGTVRSLKNEAKVAPLLSIVSNPVYPLELVEAELLNEESWKEAVKGCTHVYHVASPVSIDVKEAEQMEQAVNGTLNVLKACVEAGTVKRVVITSSVAAISGANRGDPNHLYTEADWPDKALYDVCGGYEKSKIQAERAAWDFVENLEADKKFELVTVNPSGIFGPLVAQTSLSSLVIIEMMLGNKLPMLFDYSFGIVDVRDVAAGHIAAMEKPSAAGNRYILHSGTTFSMRDIAGIISNELGPQGYTVPSRMAPKGLLWFAKFFSSQIGWFYPQLGRVMQYSNDKMINELGIEPRDSRQAIIDSCHSLIDAGIIEKKPGYRNPQLVTGREQIVVDTGKEEEQVHVSGDAAKEKDQVHISGGDTGKEEEQVQVSGDTGKEEEQVHVSGDAAKEKDQVHVSSDTGKEKEQLVDADKEPPKIDNDKEAVN